MRITCKRLFHEWNFYKKTLTTIHFYCLFTGEIIGLYEFLPSRFEVIGRHALSVILTFKMANQAITL